MIGVIGPATLKGAWVVILVTRRGSPAHLFRLAPAGGAEATGYVPMTKVLRAATVRLIMKGRISAKGRITCMTPTYRASTPSTVPLHVEVAKVISKTRAHEGDAGQRTNGPHGQVVLVIKLPDTARQVSIKTAVDTVA